MAVGPAFLLTRVTLASAAGRRHRRGTGTVSTCQLVNSSCTVTFHVHAHARLR
jgi:hypothetical protein